MLPYNQNPERNHMKFYPISENHLYRSAFRGGRRKSSRSLAVYVLRDKKAWLLKKANPEKKNINRIGIQASKKVGGAVARNRAKRVIREAYRKIDREIGIKQGWLIVITPFPSAAEVKMQDVFRDLRYCLLQLDMLPPKKSVSAEEKAVAPSVKEDERC